MAKNRSVFEVEEDGKKFELAVVKPKIDLVNKIDIKKSGLVSQAIREGAMTKSECSKIIKERGILTDADEKEKDELMSKISKLSKILEKESIPPQKGKKYAAEISEHRSRIIEINSEASEIINLSAEEVAERICMQYYTAECTTYADSGEKYFDGFEGFVEKSDTIIAIRALLETIYLHMDLDTDYEENLPENKYLEGVEDKGKKKNKKKDKEKAIELEQKVEDKNHQKDEKEDN